MTRLVFSGPPATQTTLLDVSHAQPIQHHDFFVFDLSAVSGTVTSATLELCRDRSRATVSTTILTS